VGIKYNRRKFLRTSGILGTAAIGLGNMPILPKLESENTTKLKLGLALYTTRALSLKETIAVSKRLKLEHICIKDKFHLPVDAPKDDLLTGAKTIRDNNLDFYGAGVFYMNSREEIRNTFEYARITGIKMIIGVPAPELVEFTNDLIKEYDIMIAIHNHGPTDNHYPTPESAYNRIKDFDSRFGLCIDIGHTQRCGISPGDDITRFADRLLDIHMKDVNSEFIIIFLLY